MPIHMAFRNESVFWCWTYVSIDLLFLTDMVFAFFTTIDGIGDEEEVTDRREIAK
jgi:hypothetical protein